MGKWKNEKQLIKRQKNERNENINHIKENSELLNISPDILVITWNVSIPKDFLLNNFHLKYPNTSN